MVSKIISFQVFATRATHEAFHHVSRVDQPNMVVSTFHMRDERLPYKQHTSCCQLRLTARLLITMGSHEIPAVEVSYETETQLPTKLHHYLRKTFCGIFLSLDVCCLCMPGENEVTENVAIICLLRCYVQGQSYIGKCP